MSEGENTGIKIEGATIKETVSANVDLMSKRKDLFPNFPVAGWKENDDQKICESLGMTIAPINAPDLGVQTKKMTYSLHTYGRSDFTPLIFEAYDKTKFGAIYRRGIGGANIKEGDINSVSLDKPSRLGNAGLADKNTTIAEANMSKLLHEKGIRVRLPIVTFKVNSVITGEGEKSVSELIDKGILNNDYKDNYPVISAWARRNPTTFRDTINAQDVDELLNGQAQFLRLEENNESKQVADLIDKGQGEDKWFDWLATTSGNQEARLAEVGLILPSPSDQNETLAIEFGDLGDDQDGKLRPLTESSSEEDKSAFAKQSLNAIEYILELKERFNFHKNRKLNDSTQKVAIKYINQIAQSDNGNLLTDLLDKKIDQHEFVDQNNDKFRHTLKRAIKMQKLVTTIKTKINKIKSRF